MKLYNQRNYPDKKLGYGNTTIASHGCKLVSFAMITEIDPVILNEKFKKDGCFVRDLLNDIKVGDSIDSLFEGIFIKDPKKICVAEVDMSPAPNKQQHFVVWMANGTIWDPWTGTIRPANTYPIINYRVFNFDKYLDNNTMELTKEQKKKLSKLGFDFENNLNSGELDRLLDKALELQDKPNPPVENCDIYKQQIVEKDAEIAEKNTEIADLRPKADIGNRFMEVSKMAIQ